MLRMTAWEEVQRDSDGGDFIACFVDSNEKFYVSTSIGIIPTIAY